MIPWPLATEKLPEANTDFTDEDLAYQPGQEENLMERLQKK